MQKAPLSALTQPDWVRTSAVDYPLWAIHFLLLQSYLTVAAEMLFPVLVAFKKTRLLGKLLLLPTSIAIALVSGETGFALTNAACMLLFFPLQARWSYPSAFILILTIYYVRFTVLGV